MNFNSGITLTGDLDIKLYDKNNNIKDSRHVPNLVVTAGKEYVANKLAYAGSSNMIMNAMSQMAIGTGNATSAIAQTLLTGEVQRVATATTTVSGTNITYVASFAPVSTTYTIQEAGIFNASASKSVTFDGNTSVTGSTIATVTPSIHGFTTQDQVRYTTGGGTAISGLIDSGIYYVYVTSTSSAIKLANSAANAALGGTAISGTYSSGGALGANTIVLTGTTNILPGQVITGTSGIPAGTTVTNVNTTTNTITLSSYITAAQAAGTYTFNPIIPITSGLGTNHKLASGTMMCRTTFPAINKTATTDTLVISWTITVG